MITNVLPFKLPSDISFISTFSMSSSLISASNIALFCGFAYHSNMEPDFSWPMPSISTKSVAFLILSAKPSKPIALTIFLPASVPIRGIQSANIRFTGWTCLLFSMAVCIFMHDFSPKPSMLLILSKCSGRWYMSGNCFMNPSFINFSIVCTESPSISIPLLLTNLENFLTFLAVQSGFVQCSVFTPLFLLTNMRVG